MKIVSWNVNGLARCRRNGFLKFLSDAKPDVLCCQEIKGQCPLKTPEYLQFWQALQLFRDIGSDKAAAYLISVWIGY